MASRTVEIIGIYHSDRCRFQNADGPPTVIGNVRLHNGSKEIAAAAGVADPHGLLTVKGEADSELEPQRTYRFLGHWSNYTNKRTREQEKQFTFRTFVPHIPHDPESIMQYLTQAGRGKGIGPSKARRLAEAFGFDEVLQICRTQPLEVAKVAKIDIEQAEMLAEQLQAQSATENSRLEVDRLLAGRGFPRSLSSRAIKEWGNKAAEIITDNPYHLMQFRGVGFRLTDKLWIELGKDPASVDRQALCLWYGMASSNDGHVWFPAPDAIQKLRQTVGVNADYRAAILRGREYGQISEDHYGAIASTRTDGPGGPLAENGSTLWLAEGKYASSEDRLAESVIRCLFESESQTLTRFADVEHTEVEVLQFARCARCHRALTADTVHVVDGKPYGPTCVEKVLG